MLVEGVLDERRCTVALQARDKDACLEELAELMASGSGLQGSAILAALRQREAEGSTGFEDGVAIPHARLPGDVPFVLGIATSRKGVDFASVDGKPSKLFFVLLGPDGAPQDYLRLLAHVSRLGRGAEVRRSLLAARDPAALFSLLQQHLQPATATPPTAVAAATLLILVLTDVDRLDDVMTLFVERGIEGASISESKSMGSALGEVPLFGSLLNFLSEGAGATRTIVTMLPTVELPPLIQGLEEIFGDLDNHTGLALMATDLAVAKGSLGAV
jgi:PTS system nitrogen regulatory IIA component